MTIDPQVELAFSHNYPRYEATGVDPNDLRSLKERISRWADWKSDSELVMAPCLLSAPRWKR